MVEARLLRRVSRLQKRSGSVQVGDDDIGLAGTAILELVSHVRGILKLLLDVAGTGAELLANRRLGAQRLPVPRLVTNGVRTTHLVESTVAGVVACGGPVRRGVRLALLTDALQDLLRGQRSRPG